MVLTVDGRSDKVAQYTPGIYWLKNSYAFVGGLPEEKIRLLKTSEGNFRGCMKKIKYEADAVSINFIELAGYELGESVVKAYGNLAFSCRRPDAHPDVLSFNNGQSYLTLPKWNTDASGNIGFELRTQTSDGLVLYHGVSWPNNGTSDFVAFELVDGHLFLMINLGSGSVRIEATDSKINDGKLWHSVNLSRMGRSATITVDGYSVMFSTPGVSANLNIDEKIFIGAAPWMSNDLNGTEYRFPPEVMMTSLRQGYIGCLRNVRVNGISSEISSVYEEQKALFGDAITLGCNKTLGHDFCGISPCKNLAFCENGYGSFRCDCSNTYFEGALCDVEPKVVEFAWNYSPAHIIELPYEIYSNAETVQFKFRTDKKNAVLMDTEANEGCNHRLSIFLVNEKLVWFLRKDITYQVFDWGNRLNDNRFHSFTVKRRGEKVIFFLDGKFIQSYILPTNNTVIRLRKIVAGRLLTLINDISEAYKTGYAEEFFEGQLIQAVFNGFDLLSKLQRKKFDFTISHTDSMDKVRPKGKLRKNKQFPFTFETNKAYVSFMQRYMANDDKQLRVSFRFRTLSPSCLLLAAMFNTSEQIVVLSLELFEGRLRFSFGNETHFNTVASEQKNCKKLLNDMKWHSVHVYQAKSRPEYYLVVDNNSKVLESQSLENFDLVANIFLGGIPPGVTLTPRLHMIHGFRGCISSLHVGSDSLDIQNDSNQLFNVSKGCYGPQVRCNQNPCHNEGKCIQRWSSVLCDCSMTTHGGVHCDTPGTTYVFDSTSSMIYYEYPPSRRPSRVHDRIALGFQTRQGSAVLLSIQCSAEGDYFVICLKDGYLQIRFNFGQHDHIVQYLKLAVNDNQYHVLKVLRDEANVTVKLDEISYNYTPKEGNELKTLNEQWRICVGGSFARDHNWYAAWRKKRHVFDAFEGSVSGVNVNGLMLLDMYARGKFS
uniref:Neurexin-4 n=1 Tax=Syphacia muris TaxID=451379 RepID=A0A158R697_9BILA